MAKREVGDKAAGVAFAELLRREVEQRRPEERSESNESRHGVISLVCVRQEVTIRASERNSAVLKEESKPNVEVDGVNRVQVRRSARDKNGSRNLADEFHVTIESYGQACIQDQLVPEIKHLLAALIYVAGVDVADVLINSKAMTAALLAEYEDDSAFVLAAGSSLCAT